MSTEVQLSKWQKFRKTIFWEYTQVIVVALILVFGFIRPFVVEAFKIPSGSMEDTLLIGDRILVCKFIYGFKIPGTDIRVFDFHKPARGDVFVFVPPHESKKNFIKRIVAIEGDTVRTKGKMLYVNGKAVDESGYIKDDPHKREYDFPPFRDRLTNNEFNEFRQEFREGKPFTVPKGCVFAMGDNRDNSSDSRTWGPVSVDRIKGQAFMVYWSFCSKKNPNVKKCKNEDIKIWQVWKMIGNIRFNRIGKLIHTQSGLN